MNKNLAVIGCGYWGKNLVRNFAELGALHTICDADSALVTEMAARYPGTRAETEFSRILTAEEIRGVVIAAPAAMHYSMARAALLAGKDVFVEKPLALQANEGRELVELARQKGHVLMVGHLLEYHPAVTRLKNLIDAGELGRVEYIYSNRLNLGKFRTEENILWSFAPHDISVILLLLGEMPSEVSAHGGNYLSQDIADVTLTTMSFKDGVRAHIFVSWLHPYKEQKLVVVGDKRMAVFDDMAPKDKLLLYSHGIDWVGRKPVPRPAKPLVVETSLEEPLKIECQDFLECMETRRKPRVDGEKGLRVLQILSACQRSLEEDGPPVVPGDTRPYFVHESSVLEQPCEIGAGTRIWHFSHLMPGVSVGEKCVIGQNVFIGRGVRIGNNVKIENNVSVFEGVALEDNVFCGPSCVFTNVINPRSHVAKKHEFKPTLVREGATIGANATVVCGNTIGRYAFIGAGSVVTRDIPDHALAYGNPAKVHGWACQCGEKLNFGPDGRARCAKCGESYIMKGDNLTRLGNTERTGRQ